MLRILTFSGDRYCLKLNKRPEQAAILRMVARNTGAVCFNHADGATVLRCSDIRSVDWEADNGPAWDYDDPLN